MKNYYCFYFKYFFLDLKLSVLLKSEIATEVNVMIINVFFVM